VGIVAVGIGLSARLTPARSPHALSGAPHSASRHRRRRAPTAAALAAYLDDLAREVRAGHHLNAALAGVIAPVGLAAASALGHPDAAVVTHTLSASAEVGGAVAPALDAAASVLRERAALAADAAAHSAQARLSARVLTLVPIGFAAWGVAADPRTRDAYLHTPIGIGCIAVGLMLNLAGWSWMRQIVGGVA